MASAEPEAPPMENVPEQQPEEVEVSSPTSKKTTVPPKRPTSTTATTKRSAASSSTTKTATPTSRTGPGSSLNKPPTRPTVPPTVKRPPSTATSSSAHRTRPSTSSVDEAKKGPTSPTSENKRPIVSGAAKRASLAPSTRVPPTTAATSTSRRTTLSGSSSTEKKPLASSTNASSSRSATTARSTTASSTTRTARPSTTPAAKSAASSATTDGKKRLSTIPDTPAAKTVTPTRPPLGTRKSTVSANMEQRLRELELVQNMLRIAMAEDDEEDDETKEDIDKKMGEELAHLKGKLEEARRNEGKEPLEEALQKDGQAPAESTIPSAEIQQELDSSKEKVATLEAELESIRNKLVSFTEEAESASKQVAEATENVRQEHANKIDKLNKDHAREIEVLKVEIAEKDKHNAQQVEQSLKDLETAKAAAASEGSANTSKLLDELRQTHEKEVNDIKNQLAQKSSQYDQHVEQASKDVDAARAAATEQGSAENARLVEEQRETHSKALRELTERLQAEKIAVAEEKSGETQRLLDELKQAHDTELSTLKAELSDKNAQHQRSLEDFESAQAKGVDSASQVEQLTAQLAEMKNELETAKKSAEEAASFQTIIKEKDEQLASKAQELLDSQGGLDQLKLSHAGELEQLKTAHTGELDQLKATHAGVLENSETGASKRIADIEADHEATLQRIADLERAATEVTKAHEKHNFGKEAEIKKLGNAIETLQNELETLREEKDREIETVKVSLAEEHDQNLRSALKEAETKFENSSTGLTSEHEREISDKQSLIESLSTERDSAVKIRADLKQELEDAAAQIQGLKSMLQTFDQEGQEKDKEHQASLKKVASELDRTSKALEEKSQESKSLLNKHVAELDGLRATHAKELEALKTDSTAADAMKSEHEQQLEQARASHSKELTSLKESHTSTKSTLEERIMQLEAENGKRTSDQQETAKAHEAELDDLRYQLVKAKSDFASAQAELEGSSGQKSLIDSLKEEISNLKKVHEAKLADLDDQMKSEADKRLKERQSGAEVRDKLVSQLTELEGFRAELPSVQAESKKHKADAETALAEVQQTKNELERVASTKAQLNQSLIDSNAELNTIRAEFEKFKKNARRRSRSESAYKRDVDALKITADKAQQENEVLKKQLEEALEAVERHAKKVREVEGSLRTTNLEIKELKSKTRSNGNGDLSLSGSRWATDENAAVDNEKEQPEGTELGSHIEGAMAGLQAQIRQLDQINEDMITDHQKMVKLLSGTSSSEKGGKTGGSPTGLSPLAPSFEPGKST